MSYVEEAIRQTGWGFYSGALVGFVALCQFCCGFTCMCLPLYLGLIICDIPMNAWSINAIHYTDFIGLAIGGSFVTAMSDVVGRKSCITLSLIMMCASSFSAGFAYTELGLSISQFLMGSSLTANTNSVNILLAETLPMDKRGRSVIFSNMFYSIGTLFATLLAIGFIPYVAQFSEKTTRLMNWRILYGYIGIIIVTVVCVSALILESPRYLLYERRIADALNTLKQVFCVNKSKLMNNYTITENELKGKIADFGINSERDIPNTCSSKRCIIILQRVHKSAMTLFRKKFVALTLLVVLLRCLVSFRTVMVNMLVTKTLAAQVDFKINSTDLLHLEYPIVGDCGAGVLNIGVYKDFIIFIGVGLIGEGAMMFLLGYLDRKYLLACALFLSGIFSMLLGFVYNGYVLRFLFSAFLMMGYSGAQSCLNLIIIEMFPTALRGIAIGGTAVVSNVLHALVVKFLNTRFTIIFFAIAIMLEVGAILSFALPQLRNLPMND